MPIVHLQGVGHRWPGGPAVNINKISRALYTAARVSRDVNAVTRGPGAIGRRVVRKAAGRGINGVLANILRAVLGK